MMEIIVKMTTKQLGLWLKSKQCGTPHEVAVDRREPWFSQWELSGLGDYRRERDGKFTVMTTVEFVRKRLRRKI